MPFQFSDGTTLDSGMKVINRNFDTSNLLLEAFNEVHFYRDSSFPRSGRHITTEVLEDAVYDVFWVDANRGPNDNNDPKIYPNNTTYSSQFFDVYQYSPGIDYRGGTDSRFYFDHYGGGDGVNGNGRWICYTHRSRKKVLYQGGDTASIVIGYSTWQNTGTRWLTIGRLEGIADNSDLYVWVKRIG